MDKIESLTKEEAESLGWGVETRETPGDDFVTLEQLDEALEDYVAKEAGKGLSSEDYTNQEKTKLAGIGSGAQKNVQPDWNQGVNTEDSYIQNKPMLGTMAGEDKTNYVAKEAGKGLSSEDYTNSEKTKLAGIETSAQKNVQPDWGQNATAEDDYIKNKPALGTMAGEDKTNYVAKEAGKGLSSEDYTNTEKTKLAGIETGAQKNVQPDWGQNDTAEDDYIKNKPTLGTMAGEDKTNYVAKEAGKGLSSEDYTNTEKTKLAGIETGAQKNKARLDDVWWNPSTGVVTMSFSDATPNVTKISLHSGDNVSLNGTISGTGGSGVMSLAGVTLTTQSSNGLIFTPTTPADILAKDWTIVFKV